MKPVQTAFLAASLLALAPHAARADNITPPADLFYQYTSQDNGTASWYTPATPSVDQAATGATNNVYTYINVLDGTATIDGQTKTFSEVLLYDGPNNSDHRQQEYFGIASLGLYDDYENYNGVTYSNLYTGPITAPTLLVGTWDPNALSSGGTLTATAVDSIPGVPEPATLPLVGLGLLGLAFLRRRNA